MYKKITISGLICTGKTSLFWGLQEKLIWPTFSASSFFRDYSRTHNLSLEKAEEQGEVLTKKVDLRIAEMLKISNNIIIEGWLAGIMADQLPDVLRVLLTCQDEVRIKRFAAREKMTEKEAAFHIQEREKNLLKVLQKIYHRNDFIDPRNYNFVVDTTNISVDTLVRQILSKVS